MIERVIHRIYCPEVHKCLNIADMHRDLEETTAVLEQRAGFPSRTDEDYHIQEQVRCVDSNAYRNMIKISNGAFIAAPGRQPSCRIRGEWDLAASLVALNRSLSIDEVFKKDLIGWCDIDSIPPRRSFPDEVALRNAYWNNRPEHFSVVVRSEHGGVWLATLTNLFYLQSEREQEPRNYLTIDGKAVLEIHPKKPTFVKLVDGSSPRLIHDRLLAPCDFDRNNQPYLIL